MTECSSTHPLLQSGQVAGMLAYVLFQKQKEKQQQQQQRERLKQEHNSGCCNTTSMQGWHVFFLVVNDCQ
eukprot:CAMPEP_0172694924 /NCGR_PEP_ID=MMETSP1074-20121228/27002_1 /TAXON_ID=2916 /ORGANISM="Ceratium fusus, Strain PA161109" /LENGTH=69 /DNA_ID=CAMNT_0013515477 /DNA_START=17 /DNA_END=223 /DNA_ORIENTATION=+